jgi:hypothetical protein
VAEVVQEPLVVMAVHHKAQPQETVVLGQQQQYLVHH